MALKVLMLRKKKENKQKELDELRNNSDFETREKELEAAVNELDENATEEEKETVENEVNQFEQEKREFEEKEKNLEQEIKDIEEEIKAEEEKQPKPDSDNSSTKNKNERRAGNLMETRDKFFGLNMEQRTVLFQNEEVKSFMSNLRSLFGKEKRSTKNIELTIPVNFLPMIKQIIEENSKLLKYTNSSSITGTGRIIIMGTYPEGIWTEQCASLNELDLGFNDVEVDGFKVGGFFKICNAILEDNDVNLAGEFINALGIAIGKAIDKAIVYGTGIKMPVGFVTRLAQETKPDNYSLTGREWKDLHTSNIITITGKTGIELFKDLVKARKVIVNDYSSENLVWVMNEKTHLDLLVEAMSTNVSGAIVSAMTGNTMPVAGGVIEELNFMADGDIAFGYMKNYKTVERKGVQIAQSDQVLFLDDQTAFKGTARYDGKPVIDEAFGILNISGTAPTKSVIFAPDKANSGDVELSELTIGTSKLFPNFDPKTNEYMIANVSTATSKITVKAANEKATVTIKNNETPVTNGQNATWTAGENKLTVNIKYGTQENTYTVTVNKGA